MSKKIAVLTSGGDSPGMNPAIRAVARTAQSHGVEAIGISDGYEGIFERAFVDLNERALAEVLDRGGTFLQSSRCKRFYDPSGIDEAVEILREEKIGGLIVIGGDGSLTGAREIARRGFPTIGIPGSIDNDIWGTDMSVGVDTAANTIMAMVDRIKDTARSHRRCFLVEVMGRNSGYLALITAISCGAEVAVIPEFYYNIERIHRLLQHRYEKTKDNSIILLAEGVTPASEFYERLKEVNGGELKQETRITVLGHVQRGGIPTHFDRVLANRMGELAVVGLTQGETGVMTALKKSRLTLLDLDKVIGIKKHPAPELVRLARNLGIEFGDVVET
ncbi:MAG TPA: ATP-dependent 6-phosphofructokinase [Chthoniobacterales bacterium]